MTTNEVMADLLNDGLRARFKQKAIIEFLTSEGVTPIEIHRRLKVFFGNETIDISNVRRWARVSSTGPVNLFDAPRSGRPKLRRSDELMAQIDETIRNNRRITQRQLAEKTGVGYGTVNRIIKKLDYRRICAKWVPKLLTAEMKTARKEAAQELLSRYYREGESFILNIVTGDESWISHYDPELKMQSTEYKHKNSPRQKKVRTEKSTRKMMLSVFWDSEGVILQEYLPKGTTINSERYIQTLKNLKKRLKRIRRDRSVYLLQHDNARPHTSNATIEAIQQLGFEVLPHPPYSPDLAPSDYYLFRHLKKVLKGTRFSSDVELKAAVTSFFRKQTAEFYETGMRKLISRWIRCVELDGDYVETKYFV